MTWRVIAVEGVDEPARVLSTARRQAGQDQPGRPALGPLDQPRHILGGELQPERAVQQLGGLLVGEPQIVDPELGQLPPGGGQWPVIQG